MISVKKRLASDRPPCLSSTFQMKKSGMITKFASPIFLIASLLTLLAPSSRAQDKKPWEGFWKGVITQNEGGYRTTYQLELDIREEDGKVKARSYIAVEEIFVVMELSGECFSNMFLSLKDEKILDEKTIEGLEWCFKDYQLILKEKDNLLEGYWQGETKTTPCIPGKVFLKRMTGRT
jgi:hypothetical protein